MLQPQPHMPSLSSAISLKASTPFSSQCKPKMEIESSSESIGGENSDPSSVNSTKPEDNFWDDYLRKHDLEAAPESNFYQPSIPPINKFKIGHLLKIKDRSSASTTCVGSIQDVYGPWIKIRLEGTDHSDDHYVMCDDPSCQPIISNSDLMPPINYRHGMRSFQTWKDKLLTSVDENGESRIAPRELFSPVTCPRPEKNYFKMFQRLEAMDDRNTRGGSIGTKPCLGPATIVAINGDMIKLHFDGFSPAYDFETRFDSRSLFPINYYKKIGLKLYVATEDKLRDDNARMKSLSQAAAVVNPRVGSRGGRRPQFDLRSPSVTTKEGKRSSSGSSLPEAVTPPTTVVRLSDIGADPLNRPHMVAKKPLMPPVRTPIVSRAPAPQLVHQGIRKRPLEPQNSVPSSSASEPKRSADPERQNHTNSGASSSNDGVTAGMSQRAQREFQDDFLINGARSESGGVPTDVLLSCADTVPVENRQTTVFWNRHCRIGPLLDRAKILDLRDIPQKSAIHHVVREVTQNFILCSPTPSVALRKVDAGNVRIVCVTGPANGGAQGRTSCRFIQVPRNSQVAWDQIKKLFARFDCCENLATPTPKPCMVCPKLTDAELLQILPMQSNIHCRNCITSRMNGHPQLPKIEQGESLMWTTTEVCDHIALKFPSPIVEKFREGQIDGESLRLLDQEVMMKYMGLMLSEALKVMAYIKETITYKESTL